MVERVTTMNSPKPGTCAYCQGPSEGNFSIHRDGFGEGPEVDLCDACGKDPTPTCQEIWARIAVPCDCIDCSVAGEPTH